MRKFVLTNEVQILNSFDIFRFLQVCSLHCPLHQSIPMTTVIKIALPISIIITITLCLMSSTFPITNDHLQVCKSDFEVFEALACDSFTLKDSEQKREERRVKSDAWTQVRNSLLLADTGHKHSFYTLSQFKSIFWEFHVIMKHFKQAHKAKRIEVAKSTQKYLKVPQSTQNYLKTPLHPS